MIPETFNPPAFPPELSPYYNMQAHTLLLITGPSNAGKTTWCRRLTRAACGAGWHVGGLLSLPVFASGRKVAIDLVDVAGGERRRLAAARPLAAPSGTGPTGRWHFDPAVLAWGNEVLRRSTPVDLLVIDELGPLEFEAGGGLQAAFGVLDAAAYRLATVVVRPSLLPLAVGRWPQAQPIPL